MKDVHCHCFCFGCWLPRKRRRFDHKKVFSALAYRISHSEAATRNKKVLNIVISSIPIIAAKAIPLILLLRLWRAFMSQHVCSSATLYLWPDEVTFMRKYEKAGKSILKKNIIAVSIEWWIISIILINHISINVNTTFSIISITIAITIHNKSNNNVKT